MPVTIRPYRPEDLAELTRCIVALQDHIASLDPLGRQRRTKDFDADAYVADALENAEKNGGVALLAESEGGIVGCIIGAFAVRTLHDELELRPLKIPDGKILELYVDADERGKKVGALLMQAMEKYFRDKGCAAVHVECFAPNVGAHAFYEKQGYADRTISLIKVLQDIRKMH